MKPSICVATHHASIKDLLNDAEFRSLANREGFLVELRLDFFNDLSDDTLGQALAVFAPNTLVTFRHPLEGGKQPNATDAERLRYLQRAANHGVKYIDIEARTPREGFDKRDAKLILSYHDFEKTPDEDTFIHKIWWPMHEPGVDVVKIAVMPKTANDTLILLRFLTMENGDNTSTLFLSMGELGLWTRVLAGYFNAPFTFARGEGAPGTAPGQPTWRELDEMYRFRDITSEWKIYGVIGNPIAHSLSPLMHNAAFSELGLPCVYIPFKVDSDPRHFVDECQYILDGVSVTIPHKETISRASDFIDVSAQVIGAVNTLKRDVTNFFGDEPYPWSGTNTDAPAAADCLETALGTLKDKHVLILGAGGAARAVAVGVKERGARVSVLNRTRERAEALAKELGATVVSADELGALKIDAIVNTTPIGMYPNVDASPLEENQIPKGGLVFDTVYNPLRTRLLELAEKRGCKTVEGLEMFIGQGVRQFELWTGKTAPRELMRRVVLDALKKRQK